MALYADQRDETLQIYVSKVTGRFPKPQDVLPLKPPKKKISAASKPKSQNQNGHIPETIVGSDDENIHDRPHNKNETERDRSRSPQPRKTQIDPPSQESHQTSDKEVELDEIQSILQQGGLEINQGGTGDCGYRCIAAALAHTKDEQTLLTEEASQPQGAKLRGAAVTYLRKHKEEDVKFFAADSQGESHRNFDVWLIMGKPDTWIDGLTLQALSTKTGTPFIIWRMNDRERRSLEPSHVGSCF